MIPPLSNPQLRHLKAMAQRLEPRVTIGKAGLSAGFFQSLNEALDQHELVKVKLGELKQQKKELAPILADQTSSELIMRVGHVVVLYRPQPDASRRKIHLPQ